MAVPFLVAWYITMWLDITQFRFASIHLLGDTHFCFDSCTSLWFDFQALAPLINFEHYSGFTGDYYVDI